ncbi:MAG: hypothetical protein HUN04_07910 [Desulfobacter sp.]|nr:MAG: hypothetical protein HUN04_07910 [Desulfobacter sp.]
MYKGLKILILIISAVWLSALPALAGSTYHTRVRVIQAGQGPSHVDPGIRNVVREIQPVFKYTRFKLIKEKTMVLSQGRKGQMSLPGRRNLTIVPQGMSGNRIQYSIRINAKGKQVFRTGVALKNNGSVTIGGPRVSKGILLLDIQGRVQ